MSLPLILHKIEDIKQQWIFEGEYPEEELHFIETMGGTLYPKYLFNGNVELENITYFDARNLAIAEDAYFDVRKILKWAVKIVKTCATSYGRIYYHIETECGGRYVIIHDKGICEVITEVEDKCL